ncbi:28S ribosomal protein S9, mitochondrial-like isoform X2 [Mercenaria mercenaria]|nr:28S ribosomal protein S9, mitochondrial-like isoform X2 [Mercenaria mercenaria]
MSFTFLKHFRHFNFIQISSREVNVLNKLCMHCTAVHRQRDDGTGPGNLVGPPQTLKSISKEDMISKAIKHYLERKQKSDEIMERHKAEYDLGRRHLANMMSVDEDELTPEKIREAISYLLPSGLHNRKARPLMEHPSFYIPYVKGQEFDMQGRPTHFLYYTLKPRYFELMHTMAWKLEKLKKMVSGSDRRSLEKEPDLGKEWLSEQEFLNMFPGEKVNEHEYKRFVVLAQRLLDHPLSQGEKQFLDKYRRAIVAFSAISDVEEPKLDEHGREYVIAKGRRKTAKAIVKLISKGHGNININGQDITYFEQIIHRQAILAPLQLCGVLDKFDIEARVLSKGPTADAGAIRLAISRGLLSFIPVDMREQLRIAGYLTSDPRMRERKKPGQEKARKKFTW